MAALAATEDARAELAGLVSKLETFVLATNLRGVRATCREVEAKFTQSSSSSSSSSTLALALDVGSVQALLGALNQCRRDSQVTETVLNCVVGLGPRVSLLAPLPQQPPSTTVSVALLLRSEGLLSICRAANEHRQNGKILSLALRTIANCCRDEQGSRMVVFGPVFAFLLEVLAMLADGSGGGGTSSTSQQNRDLVALVLFAVSYCTMFHVEARVQLSLHARAVSAMIALCRQFQGEADVLEPAVTVFCMLSTHASSSSSSSSSSEGESSEDGELASSSSSATTKKKTAASLLKKQQDVDDIGSIALSALNTFALRTFEDVAASASSATTAGAAAGGPSPSKLQSFTARWVGGAAAASSSSTTPPLVVTSSTERRCSSWCLLLLSNLAKTNAAVRNQIIQTVVHAGVRETELRYQKLLERLLASCFDDVVAAGAREDAKDFLHLAPSPPGEEAAREEETEGEEETGFFSRLLLLSGEDALMSAVLLAPDPSALLGRAQDQLTQELTHASSSSLQPVSVLGSRLYALVFAMLQHPSVRAKLSPAVLDSVANGLLQATRARAGENGEYYTLLYKQLEQKLASSSVMVRIPFRAFPLLVDVASASALLLPIPELDLADFTFAAWRHLPKELCHQITLKMEAMFASIDPTSCVAQREQNKRLLVFHSRLQRAIQRELLATPTAEERALLLECIIDVASYSATGIVGNLDLTMLCLALLQSRCIKRLALTWKRVRDQYKRVLQELLTLSAFQDLGQLDVPPPLLQSPRVPYLLGFLRAVDNNKEQEHPQQQLYACFNAWFPHLGKNGDWHSRSSQFTPLPGVQIALGRIANAKDDGTGEDDGEGDMLFHRLSNEVEPDWLISQGEAHDALVLQSQIETLVEGLDALRFVQKQQQQQVMSIEACGKLVSVLAEELVGKKRVPARTFAVQVCLERIVLGPVSTRLFLQAVQHCKHEEHEFQTKLSHIKLSTTTAATPVWWMDALAIPEHLAAVPWRGAVAALNGWVCSAAAAPLPPTQALELLLRFKDELFAEAQAHKLKHLTAEDLIPIVCLVLVRSNVLNYSLCSHMYFIKTFLGDDELAKNGEALYYLITLESAVYQVRKVTTTTTGV